MIECLVSQRKAPTASVIIPAHQEEAVLGRCLEALLGDAERGEFDVLVVANGCTDRTSDIAQSFEPWVRLLELDQGSKSAALNAGDAAARTFPRIYLDADVEITTATARELIAELSVPEPLLATPSRRMVLEDASLVTRWYFHTWEVLQQSRGETIGTGVYALNRSGRARFGLFPTSIGDDLHVHNLFTRVERRQIAGVARVWPPQNLKDLIAVRTRVTIGNLTASTRPGHGRPPLRQQLLPLVGHPTAVAGLPLYLSITLLIRARARRRLQQGDLSWTRIERSWP